jgi:hypothetical protein
MRRKPQQYIVLALMVMTICGIVLLFFASLPGSPTIRRIADLTSSDFEIDLRPEFYPPYHLVVGVPDAADTAPEFRGIVEITGPDGNTQTIAIGSDTSSKSNWLRDPFLTGFVLAWDRPQILASNLKRGDTYRLHFLFSVPPPKGCSLWFSSIRRWQIITNKSA